MPETKMLEVADRLKELKAQKSELDYESKRIGEQVALVEQALIQLMTDEECESFKRNGVNFSLVISKYPAAIPELKGDLYDAMKEHGFEHLFTINTRTLQATIKEEMENNDNTMPKWLDGLVKVAEKATIQVRKA